MSERDPRREPAKGDVLSKDGRVREIHSVTYGVVNYRFQFGCKLYGVYDFTWRKWAAKATVVRKAGDAK